MTVLLDLADAVVSELNAPIVSGDFTGWSQDFTAVRRNVPRFSAADMGALHVTVRSKDRMSTRATRSIMQDMCRVYVSIQKKLVSDDNSETDPLIALGEEIQAYFDQKMPLLQMPPVVCEGSAFGSDSESNWLNVKNQDQLLLYTGLVVLTFRVMRKGALAT